MIFKVIDGNNNSKTIIASSFESLKEKICDKFQFKTQTFKSKDFDIEIEDCEVFDEILKTAESSSIKVLTIEIEPQTGILKKDTTYVASPKSAAKKPDDLAGDENDQDDFFSELSSMKNDLSELKSTISIQPTNLEEKIRKHQIDCKKIQERISLKKQENLTENYETEKRKKSELIKEYNRLKFDTETTKEIRRSELKDLESRVCELKAKQAKISQLFQDLKNSEKVDICFMTDCTGSMSGYINEAKTVIHRVVDRLSKKFKDFELRCSFVGYRDHSDGPNRVTVLPFTENKDNFKSFVTTVSAQGGADECEDIFGGLEEVTKLIWKNMSRVLFHIGDAPCHGSRFHCGSGDSHPGGDPRGLNITNLLKQLVGLNVQYYFAEINTTTVKMIEEFNKELALMQGSEIKVCKLSGAEALLDTISSSISSTIMLSKSLSMHSGHGKPVKKINVELGPIDWRIENFKKYNADYSVASFESEIDNIKNNQVKYENNKVEIWVAPKPFAKGGLRYAYAALLNMGTSTRPKLVKSVIKETLFASSEYNTSKYYKDLIEIQVIAQYLANKFNEISKSEKTLKFLDVNFIQLEENGVNYSIEDYVDGTFKKWINNAGVINEEEYASTLNAFSHWSYHATNEYLMITDLQGFQNESCYILTDPAITCLDDWDRFTSTNLGKKGLKKYFESHQCNQICEDLGLKKGKYQSLPNRPKSTLDTKFKA